MLELEIKALNESVKANTAMLEKVLAALTITDVKSQVKAEPKLKAAKAETKIAKAETVKAEAAKAEPIIEPETATAAVTANDLKALAKDAIAEGVLRTDIKKLITDAGADTISALNDEQRAEVFNALTKLKGK